MNGAGQLVESLRAHAVEVAFGIISTHMMEVYDAMARAGAPRLVSGHHESALVYMADGYWRACGRPGVVLTSTGPGVANSVGAMGEAYACSASVLNITSTIPLEYLGKNRGYLHEAKDQTAMLETVTAWTRLVRRAADIGGAVDDAFEHFAARRPRPLALEVPIPFWREQVGDVERASARGGGGFTADERSIEQAARLLASARRPVIWAGGGVTSAAAFRELQALAESLGAPVVVTSGGKGAFPADHDLFVGVAWVVGSQLSADGPLFGLVEGADAILAVGTRFSRSSTGMWKLRMPRNLVQVDIDRGELGKIYPAEVAIEGDARHVLGRLVERLSGRQGAGPSQARVEEARAARAAHEEKVRSLAPALCRMVDGLRAAIPRRALVVADATVLMNRWGNAIFPVYEPRGWISPHGWTGIGFGFPAAIGAALAAGGRPVVAFTGDGGFQFNLQELATIREAGANLVVVVLNDGAYGALKEQQQTLYAGRYIGTAIGGPDYVRLAEAYGIAGVRASSLGELMSQLERAIGRSEPCVIDAAMPQGLERFPTDA